MEDVSVSNLTLRQLNAVVDKLGGDDAALLFLCGDVKVVNLRQWKEHAGVINFSITSEGTSGLEWIERLKRGGSMVTKKAEEVLFLNNFKPSNGVTFEITVLKGALYETSESHLKAAGPFQGIRLIDGTYRDNRRILSDASWRKLKMPTAEIACLIREKFSDSEMNKMGIGEFVVMQGTFGEAKSAIAWLIKDGKLDLTITYEFTNWPSYAGFVFIA